MRRSSQHLSYISLGCISLLWGGNSLNFSSARSYCSRGGNANFSNSYFWAHFTKCNFCTDIYYATSVNLTPLHELCPLETNLQSISVSEGILQVVGRHYVTSLPLLLTPESPQHRATTVCIAGWLQHSPVHLNGSHSEGSTAHQT